MSNTKFKIIYSLKIHLELQKMGFKYETEMKNPSNGRYNCWVYKESEALLAAFDKLVGGSKDGR